MVNVTAEVSVTSCISALLRRNSFVPFVTGSAWNAVCTLQQQRVEVAGSRLRGREAVGGVLVHHGVEADMMARIDGRASRLQLALSAVRSRCFMLLLF